MVDNGYNGYNLGNLNNGQSPIWKEKMWSSRQNWLHYAKKYVFEEKLGGFEYEESLHNDIRVYNAVNNREF